MTGTIFLALVTFGVWSDAHTTLAQLAAKVAQVGEPRAVSPAAMSQRMHKGALALLQDLIRHALATVQAIENVGDAGLCTFCTNVYRAERTGFGLPDRWHDLLPGSGGSATTAGANMHAVGESKSRLFGQGALTPWNMPDQHYLDNVVALANKGSVCLGDGGYLKSNALASSVEAGADF